MANLIFTIWFPFSYWLGGSFVIPWPSKTIVSSYVVPYLILTSVFPVKVSTFTFPPSTAYVIEMYFSVVILNPSL